MKNIHFTLVIVLSFFSESGFAQPKNLFDAKDLSKWHVDVPDMDKDPKLKSLLLFETECS